MRLRFFLLAFFLPAFYVCSQNMPAPNGLICELLREPSKAVITDATPAFGWIFPQGGIKQSAYRILVASSPFLLKENQADLWDSKKTKSRNSQNIVYSGKALNSNSTYWWIVKVWSENGLESNFSLPQQFNTGNFDRSNVDYPGQSKWVELSSNDWVSEDKQCATQQLQDPANVMYSENGNYFVEFEKSVIGTLEFTASATRNTSVTVYLGERKDDNQSVHKKPGRSNIGYQKVEMNLKKGEYHYTVKLKEKNPEGYLHSQKLAPHYPEVMPFRYVEIEGDIENISISATKQAALFYYFDETASGFQCADDNLKSVWDLCKYTQKSTPFLGVYCDGNRERMPYEADAYIQMLSHFATDREYSIARYTINFLLDHASWPTEWQMHMVLMVWEYYMQTGDKNLLIERYDDIKRKSLIALTDENGLISTRTGKKTEDFLRALNFPGTVEKFDDIVDWPQGTPKGQKNPAAYYSPFEGGETDGFVYTDYNAVVNAFHNRSLVLMSKIAGVVDNQQDMTFFTKRAREHRANYYSVFFNKEKGIFKDGESTGHSSLHANMFPMAFNMVHENDIKTVADFIKSRGMACSVYGSQYLLESLYKAGDAEHALALMTSDSKRSWLNMIRVGSTMTTEAWDESFKPNLTWNHAWGSAPANIIVRKLMGIEPIEPAFSRFRINPQPGNLAKASIKVPSIRGTIGCEIENNGNSWLMQVSIPGNSEAEIWLPEEFSIISVNGEKAEIIRSENFARGKRNIITLNSGIFTISAKI